MKRSRSFAVVVLCVAGLGVSAVPAAASCAAPIGSLRDRVGAAEFAFVGTVTIASDSGRLAQVDVEESWRGDVEESATVNGGATGPGSVSSVDRSYQEGQRYLFMPYAFESGEYRDNNCSGTQHWSAKLDKLRPDDAVMYAAPLADDGAPADPQPSSSSTSMPTWLPWIVAAAALALAALAYALRGRITRTAT